MKQIHVNKKIMNKIPLTKEIRCLIVAGKHNEQLIKSLEQKCTVTCIDAKEVKKSGSLAMAALEYDIVIDGDNNVFKNRFHLDVAPFISGFEVEA